MQVKPNETAKEIVNRCRHLFNLDSEESQDKTNSDYQLWLKTGKNDPLMPLKGKSLKIS